MNDGRISNATFTWRAIVIGWLMFLTYVVIDLHGKTKANEQTIDVILEIDSTQTENICIIVDGLTEFLSTQ